MVRQKKANPLDINGQMPLDRPTIFNAHRDWLVYVHGFMHHHVVLTRNWVGVGDVHGILSRLDLDKYLYSACTNVFIPPSLNSDACTSR
jgi:hypothetical protein